MLEELLLRALPPGAVRPDGDYTLPRTWGVYQVSWPGSGPGAARYRMGNHPIRQLELVREFGNASLIALYTRREDALEHKAILGQQAT